MIPLFRKKPTPFYRPPPQPKPTQTMTSTENLQNITRTTFPEQDGLPKWSYELHFQLLHPSAKLPTRGSEHAAGLDLYAASWQPYGESMIQYDTGVAVAIPEGYVGLVFPRSSITGTSLRLANAVGVIDPDYRGSIKFRFDSLSLPDSEPNYGIGDRIGQLVIVPAPRFEPIQVDELPATVRGEGGFGSTGR